MNKVHCWHTTGHNTGADRDEICCQCGIVYHPSIKVPYPGHGPFSPEKMTPERLDGPCARGVHDAPENGTQRN
jgi:hypothetical protein